MRGWISTRLGCVLFELVCGRPPFVGSRQECIAQHLGSDAPPVHHHAEGVPDNLSELIERLLQKRPKQRIGYADDVVPLLRASGAEASPLSGLPYLHRSDFYGQADALAVVERAFERMHDAPARVILVAGEADGEDALLARGFSSRSDRAEPPHRRVQRAALLVGSPERGGGRGAAPPVRASARRLGRSHDPSAVAARRHGGSRGRARALVPGRRAGVRGERGDRRDRDQRDLSVADRDAARAAAWSRRGRRCSRSTTCTRPIR